MLKYKFLCAGISVLIYPRTLFPAIPWFNGGYFIVSVLNRDPGISI